MGSYQVVLNGQNFWLKREGRVQRMGFYTIRFVDAADSTSAEAQALALVRGDPKLSAENDPSDGPIVRVERVHEVNPKEVPTMQPGYALYPDKREADA